MGTVIAFPPSLLEPFLGNWIRDPVSVSRNKVVKRTLGEDGMKLLWRCGSMADVRRCLRADAELAAKYEALCRLGSEGRLVIARRLMTWTEAAVDFKPARTVSAPITRITAQGRSVMVQTSSSPTVVGYVLRWKNEWLLVSESYAGLNVVYFPPSPVFRYYRAD
jgi:hypothetical protein